MATVIRPGTSEVQPSFVPVAKHYGVDVEPCPPRHGNRKGVVEKAIDYLTQRWWRTARVATGRSAGVGGPVLHRRRRRIAVAAPARVAELADAEPLLALPARAFPAEVTVVRSRRRERVGVVVG